MSRFGVYCVPRAAGDADLVLMRRIDELHLGHAFVGTRMPARVPRREVVPVGRKHFCTLMKRMASRRCIAGETRAANVRPTGSGPYLQRNRKIDRSNQVWALDATYVALARGFMYSQAAGAGRREGLCT